MTWSMKHAFICIGKETFSFNYLIPQITLSLENCFCFFSFFLKQGIDNMCSIPNADSRHFL